MRKHFYRYFTAVLLAVAAVMFASPAFAADAEPVVDTITLDNELLWDGNVPADISWKTRQDKGKWIEELGIAEDATSLVLVINSLDKEDSEALPSLAEQNEEVKEPEVSSPGLSVIKDGIDGHSSLIYLSKNAEGEWLEIFSADCMISGGELWKNEDVYGIYKPEQAFGNLENPGSLLPFKKLTSDDYWILNPKDERYGNIYSTKDTENVPAGIMKMLARKVYFNYGMVVKSVNENSTFSALLLSCLQLDPGKDQFGGIKLPEESLRMLLQCVDENTRIVIVGSADELADLQK